MSDAAGTGDDAARGRGIALGETERPVSADEVEGAPVHNRAGGRLGSVHAVMVDECSGQVLCAAMSFGGFLGAVGERHRPLPWKALDRDPEAGGCVAGITREQPERAPSYAGDGAPWGNPGRGLSVYDRYGMT